MASRILPIPAFGEADLSNCEREQIHLAGSIQPHGALLALDQPCGEVIQASATAGAFLDAGGGVLGRALGDLLPDLAERVRHGLDEPLDRIPTALRCHRPADGGSLDALLHRPPEGGLIVELERAGQPVDLQRDVERSLLPILQAASLPRLAEETARIYREITGYDRVMVYRFDDEGHGEVFAESRNDAIEPFLGNRYPASDIPQIARRLYERNRIRVLVDVGFDPVPLEPVLSPLTGQPLDMSLCFLRSPSPIHVQYLQNMGVAATLVVSLMVGGRLWGLIACHHYAPRFIHYELRAVAELLAETVATRIAALESFAQAQAELSVRRLEQRMIEAVARDGEWRGALFDQPQALLQTVEASGAALLFDGQILTAGEVPGTQDLRNIGAWLDERSRLPVVATAALGLDEPRFAPLTAVASGLLATPISTTPGEYLLWFRPERVRTVTWGGNPFKPVTVGDDPRDLSPRRSFAQWHELVEGTSDPWRPADLTAARLIGDTVADVILQFQSVRMLIVQDQLARVGDQVRGSDQPVIIADAGGRILLANEAFGAMLDGLDVPPLGSLGDLAPLFTPADDLRRAVGELVEQRRIWRGEVELTSASGTVRPLMLRADPVMSSPRRVLGFVLLFTDLTQRKAAESARRDFQERVIESNRLSHVRQNRQSDLVHRNLLSSVVENAQLAALEITDGEDVGRMPDLLESVQSSVSRAAELLEHLVEHGSRAADDPPSGEGR